MQCAKCKLIYTYHNLHEFTIFAIADGGHFILSNVENFNAQLRAIFPKHSLLDSYTQNDLYFAASNLNSRHLNSIDDKTPADLFIEVFGIELFEALHLKKIKGDEVKLKPIHS